MKRQSVGIVMAAVVVALITGAFVAARFARHRALLSSMPEIPLDRLNRSARVLISNARTQVENEPLRADRWAELGYALGGNGAFTDPGPCFARAEELDPTNHRWPHLFAVATITRDRGPAIAALQRSLALRPNVVSTLAILAEARLEDGATAEVDALLRPIVTDRTNEPRLLWLMAQVEANAGVDARALELAKHAAAFPPHRRRVHQLLAQLYRRNGDAANAHREARLLELLPPAEQEEPWPDPIAAQTEKYARDPQAVAAQARTLISQGRFEEAKRVIEQLEPEDSQAPAVQAALAIAHAQLGHVAKAESIFATLAGEKDPNVAFARGFVASLQNKFAEASEAYLLAATTVSSKDGTPFVSGALVNQGLCLQAMKKDDEAAAAFDRALKVNPGNLEAIVRLSELHLTKNRKADAAKLLDDAALLAPSNERIMELRTQAGGRASSASDSP